MEAKQTNHAAIDSDLAWETFVPRDSQPAELWRVLSNRYWGERPVRQSNWFATEKDANEHVAWIENGRGEVLSVTHYVAAASPAPEQEKC